MAAVEVDFAPKLFPWQARVLGESKRFNVLAKGRRSGGTSLVEDIAIDCALRGHPVGWFSQSDKLLLETWRRFCVALAPVIERKDETKRRLDLRSGEYGKGILECWSCESEVTTRSRKYYMAGIDEAAHIAKFDTIWEQEIRPSLMDLRGGAWFPSSPNGMGYFRTLWERGQDPADLEWASWQIPSTENPLLHPDELEGMKHDLCGTSYRQEVLAEFVSIEGAVFAEFSRTKHIQPLKIEPNLPLWIGIDFGYRTFGMVAVQVDKHDTMRVVSEGEWKELTTEQAIGRIKQFEWADRIEGIACDPAGDARNIQSGIGDVALLRAAFPLARVSFSTAPNHRDPEWRASRLRDRIWSAAGDVRLYVDPSCRQTIRMLELSVYPKVRPGTGEKQQPQKDGIYDHLRDALGYVNVALTRAPSIVSSRRPF